MSGDWRDGVGPELTAGAGILAYSAALNSVIPESLHVPANLATAGLLTWFAWKSGATRSDMGMAHDDVREGLSMGLKTVLPIAVVVVGGIAIPGTRGLFTGEELAQGSTAHALYEILVRIPFGTAIPEEIIFRGALLGLLLRRHSPWKSATVSSLLFGVWHVLPTLDTLRNGDAGEVVHRSFLGRGGAVATTVALTAAAGMGFSWLRYRSRSVVAPAIAHIAVNDTAALGGRLAKRVLHLARLRAGTIGTI